MRTKSSCIYIQSVKMRENVAGLTHDAQYVLLLRKIIVVLEKNFLVHFTSCWSFSFGTRSRVHKQKNMYFRFLLELETETAHIH